MSNDAQATKYGGPVGLRLAVRTRRRHPCRGVDTLFDPRVCGNLPGGHRAGLGSKAGLLRQLSRQTSCWPLSWTGVIVARWSRLPVATRGRKSRSRVGGDGRPQSAPS